MHLRQLIRLIIGILGLLNTGFAWSLGLGEVMVKSAYNEPLNAEIRLLEPQGLTESEILVALASSEDFARIGVEREFFLTKLSFTVSLDNPNNPHIKVTSKEPVREPYLNFLVNTQWPSGRLLREYTILLDLPVFADETSTPSITPVESVPPTIVEPPSVQEPQLVQTPPPVSVAQTESKSKVKSPEPETSHPIEKPSRREPQFSSATDAANSLIRQLSREAAERKSSFPIQLPSEPEEVKTSSPTKEVIRSITPEEAPVSLTGQSRKQLDIDESASIVDEPDTSVPAEPETKVVQEEHHVQAGDTLWRIASQLRPNSSVSVQQTMLALQAVNPDAFINDNINLLRKGKTLRAPTLSEIQNTSFRQAVTAVQRQNQAWRETQQKATLSVVPATPVAKPASVQKQGRLTLLSANNSERHEVKGNGISGSGESLQNELAIVKEELDKASRENSNLKMRISELENQIDTLEGLMQLTNDQLKALELATGQTSEEQPFTEEKPIQVSVNQEAADKLAPEKSEPFLQVITRMITDHLMIIVGVLGAVLLTALIIMRIRQGKDGGDVDDNGDLELDDLALDDGLAAVSLDGNDNLDVLDDQLQKLDEALDKGEAGDVVTEAEIYLGLEQLEKAEGLLQQEIQQNPDNAEARVVLLKIYAKTQNAEAFDDQYAQLLPLGDIASNNQAKILRESISNIGDFDVDSYSLDDPDFSQADSLVDEANDLDKLGVVDNDDSSLDNDESFEEVGEIELDDGGLGEIDSLSVDEATEPQRQGEENLADEDEEPKVSVISDGEDDSLELNNDLLIAGDTESVDFERNDSLDKQDNFSLSEKVGEKDREEEFERELSGDISSLANDTAEELLDNAEQASVEFEIDENLLNDLPSDSDRESALPDEEFQTDDMDDELDLGEDFLSSLSGDIEDDNVSALDNDDENEIDLSLNELDIESALDLELLDVDSDGDDSPAMLSEGIVDEGGIGQDHDGISIDGDLSGNPVEDEVELASDIDDINATSKNDVLVADTGIEVETETNDNFDLDLPPEDLDIDSLDKEIDAMTAVLEEDSSQSEAAVKLGPEVVKPEVSDDDLTEEELEFLNDVDEVETKLDLARAYIDMGDTEGAQDILGEVLEEGNQDQQQDAQKLLNSL